MCCFTKLGDRCRIHLSFLSPGLPEPLLDRKNRAGDGNTNLKFLPEAAQAKPGLNRDMQK